STPASRSVRPPPATPPSTSPTASSTRAAVASSSTPTHSPSCTSKRRGGCVRSTASAPTRSSSPRAASSASLTASSSPASSATATRSSTTETPTRAPRWPSRADAPGVTRRWPSRVCRPLDHPRDAHRSGCADPHHARCSVTPVMRDQRHLINLEVIEDRDEIAHHIDRGGGLWVLGALGFAITAQVRRDGHVAGVDNGLHLRPPGAPQIRKAMEEHHGLAVARGDEVLTASVQVFMVMLEDLVSHLRTSLSIGATALGR